MSEYEFTFVLQGISVDDYAVQVPTDELDALISRFHGVFRMSVASHGPDAATAAANVFAHGRKHAPEVRLL
ncbi:hypothetical protein HNR23_000586 [Nocardiopsis mwathae]|uniref:Uncharacterized protein n=1 Tax=Nocardiopsis mwathae TaxID=1472723 RepID=A0A7X0D498_9ACTN|nr:hypothetical protein [Nocardiopsis mwathae]MBB6170526.1 hypothetical protein [Nocardiopsis mwathae]